MTDKITRRVLAGEKAMSPCWNSLTVNGILSIDSTGAPEDNGEVWRDE